MYGGDGYCLYQFSKADNEKGDAVFIFTDIVFVTIEVSDTFSALYVSLSEEVMEEVFYKITPTSFWYFIYDHVILHLSENQFMLLHTWYQQTKWIIDECAQEYKLTLLRNNIHSLLWLSTVKRKKKYRNQRSLQKRSDMGYPGKVRQSVS